ncbi:uncharacterized protein METZ01_LOCUS67579 [marine metagenome]|uniref:Uncharacterized protein n=1 Tax=marine metagenome TaxID=408172 RepID=A0A381TF02_9ZZZZ
MIYKGFFISSWGPSYQFLNNFLNEIKGLQRFSDVLRVMSRHVITGRPAGGIAIPLNI